MTTLPTASSSNRSTSVDAAWMEFQDRNGTTYYYDFVNGVRQTSRPSAAVTDTARQPPTSINAKIFEHAASLHKSPSMKK